MYLMCCIYIRHCRQSKARLEFVRIQEKDREQKRTKTETLRKQRRRLGEALDL
ncbi:unnamed protein product [Arabidopsis halleri]